MKSPSRITAMSKAFDRSDLEVFNILQHPVWVFDVLQMRMFWGNDAALQMWRAETLEALLARDFSDTTPSTAARMRERHAKLQKGYTTHEQWTIYPNGKAKTVDIHISGICIKGNDSDDVIDQGDDTDTTTNYNKKTTRLACLVEADMPTDQVSNDTKRGLELFRHARVAVGAFHLDKKTSDASDHESTKTSNGNVNSVYNSGNVSHEKNIKSGIIKTDQDEVIARPIYRNSQDVQLYGSDNLLERFVDQNQGRHLLTQLQKLQVSSKAKTTNRSKTTDANRDQDQKKEDNDEGDNDNGNDGAKDSNTPDIELEVQHYLQDGTTVRWYSISCHWGKDPATGQDIIIYTGRDITDIVQARLETIHAQRKLNFLSKVTHELRTPLHQITGFTDILEDMDELTSSQRDCVKFIQSSASSLMTIINDLLDYNRFENQNKLDKVDNNGDLMNKATNTQTNRFQHFSLRRFVGDFASSIKRKVEQAGISFSLSYNFGQDQNDVDTKHIAALQAIDSNEGDVIVLSDISKIRRILMTLVENAIKFTKHNPNGRISLIVSDGYPCTNTHDTSTKKSAIQTITFHVQDNGIGISQHNQELLFDQIRESFDPSRSDCLAQSTRSHDGTGIGLVIASKLCQELDGSIHVDSELEKGSTFTVQLPMEISKVTTKEGQTKYAAESTDIMFLEDAVPCEPLLVLIVEDNDVNAKMVKRMMERMGHQTVRAEHGQAALDALTQENQGSNIDLVLMDIHMPVMDGIEATKRIREKRNGNLYCYSQANLPIIGLTASFQLEAVQQYMDVGMNDCLGKPVRMSILEKRIRTVMARCAVGFYSDDTPMMEYDSKYLNG